MLHSRITTKIRMGFIVMIILPLGLGLTAWLGADRLQESMGSYVSWGEIDMVMNEDVTQKLLKLENNVQVAQYSQDEKNLQALDKSFADTKSGLEKWRGLIEGHPGLLKLADQIKGRLTQFKLRADQHHGTQVKRKGILAKWDQLVDSTLTHLEKTMVDVIDPHKEKTAQEKNIEGMNLWGNIDMIMNEAVIANFLKLKTAAHDYVALESPANLKAMNTQLDQTKAGLDEWKKVVSGQKLMEEAAEVISRNLAEFETLMGQYGSQAKQAGAAQEEMRSAMQSCMAELEKGMEEVIDPAKMAAVHKAKEDQNNTCNLILVVSIAAVFIGILLSWLISRSIIGPLKSVISGLSAGAQQVASAAGEINLSSQTLAQGSSQQAASLEETSSSMEQMASMTNQNANNANQVNGLMQNANRVFAQANKSMQELKQAIEKISAASDDTVKIIKTIDEIAFQTNLLALNAAVEAARAGEAGAGFAVVADEVRNLAIRAAEAARNTASLIEENLKDIKIGSELVSTTDEAFRETSVSTQKVSELVAEIAGASSEQSQGISQVNKALSELSQVTQHNAASAEESSAASQELASQADSMEAYVSELAGMVGQGGNETGNGDSAGRGKTGSKPTQRLAAKQRPTPAAKAIPLSDDFEDF